MFDELLHEVELVKEKIAEFPSYSNEYLDDEIGGDIHGDIHEEIYMKQPKGYIIDPYLVFKLKKSLYGLKQAPREWYSKMEAFLLSQKFQRCK